MSTHPLLDLTMKNLQDLSANDRANWVRHINQIAGNTEFVAIYPSHEALHKAEQRVSQFNEKVASVVMVSRKGYDAGRATSGLLYIYAQVSEDQQYALGELLRIGCKGNVASVREK